MKEPFDTVVKNLPPLSEENCVYLRDGVNFITINTDRVPYLFDGIEPVVTAAKTFAENKLDAAAFFDDWIVPGCFPVSEKPWGNSTRTDTIWAAILSVPDHVATSKGCFTNSCDTPPRAPPFTPLPYPTVEPEPDSKNQSTWRSFGANVAGVSTPYNLNAYPGFELVEDRSDIADGMTRWYLSYYTREIAQVRVASGGGAEGIRIDDMMTRDFEGELLTPINGRDIVFSLYYTISGNTLDKLMYIDIKNIVETTWVDVQFNVYRENGWRHSRQVILDADSDADAYEFNAFIQSTIWGSVVNKALLQYEDLEDRCIESINIYKGMWGTANCMLVTLNDCP